MTKRSRKENSARTFTKTAFIILIILLVPQILAARGTQEANRGIDQELQNTFEGIIEAVANGEMTAAQARAEIGDLSVQYRLEKNYEYTKMLGMLGDLENGTETQERVREQLYIVNEETQVRERLQEQSGDCEGAVEPIPNQDRDQIKDQTNKKTDQ
jgi:hypothetical protein